MRERIGSWLALKRFILLWDFTCVFLSTSSQNYLAFKEFAKQFHIILINHEPGYWLHAISWIILHRTSSFHPSSIALPGMNGFSARHDNTKPLSSTLGVKTMILELVLIPSWTWSSLDGNSCSPLFHQVISAGGLEPLDEHTSSTSFWAESGLFGGWIATSSGVTAVRNISSTLHFDIEAHLSKPTTTFLHSALFTVFSSKIIPWKVEASMIQLPPTHYGSVIPSS